MDGLLGMRDDQMQEQPVQERDGLLEQGRKLVCVQGPTAPK